MWFFLFTAAVSRGEQGSPGGACPHMQSRQKADACMRAPFLQYSLMAPCELALPYLWLPPAWRCDAACHDSKPKRLDNHNQILTRHDPMKTPMLRGVQ